MYSCRHFMKLFFLSHLLKKRRKYCVLFFLEPFSLTHISIVLSKKMQKIFSSFCFQSKINAGLVASVNLQNYLTSKIPNKRLTLLVIFKLCYTEQPAGFP